MKFVAFLTIALAAVVSVRAGDVAGYKSESKVMSEIFTSKISKVYAVQDGDYQYAAYAVDWRGHEVIVMAYSSRHDDLTVGETVRCEMRQMHGSALAGGKGRMAFTLLGRPGDPVTVGAGLTGPDDMARLQAVSAEVSRRRAEREAQGGKVSPGSSSSLPAPSAAESRRP